MIIHKKINLKITLADLKKVIGLTLVVVLLVSGFFVFAEPGMVQAATTQAVVVTLTVTAGAALTVDNNTNAMSTAISVSQNTAVATSTFTVTTNDYLGYTLKLSASSTLPAMTSASSSIPDAVATPALYPGIVPAASSTFAFSAYSTTTTNVDASTWETGGHATGCANGANTPSATLKYRGFNGSNGITVASNTSTTTTAGTVIIVCYMAAQNGVYIPSGNYNATITGTVTTN
jgi:hypothetical protein